MHWRQVPRIPEIPWLNGHTIQGEYLFPTTGFVTVLYEAAIRLVPSTEPTEVRGVHMSQLPGSCKGGRELYAQEIWERDAQSDIESGKEAQVSAERVEVGRLAARMALFYCRKMTTQIKPLETMLMSKDRRALMRWVQKDLVARAQAVEHPGTEK